MRGLNDTGCVAESSPHLHPFSPNWRFFVIIEAMKKIIPIILFLVVAGALFYFFDRTNKKSEEIGNQQKTEMQTQSQIKTEILKEGSGEAAKEGNKITVHYTGWLEDGKKFDSSLERGTPFAFTLGAGQVIKGWDEGLVGTKVGEKLKLIIPPELGYGAAGIPGGPIPPNATLIFEIEVLKIE